MMLRRDAEFFLSEGGNLRAAVLPVLPDGLAPAADHGVAGRSRFGGENVGAADGGALLRNRRRDPLRPIAGQLHVSALYLAAREVLLEIEVEAYKSEDD